MTYFENVYDVYVYVYVYAAGKQSRVALRCSGKLAVKQLML